MANFSDTLYVFTPGSVGVTATRTSAGHDVSLRESVSLIFTSSGITSGNGVFTVDASNDNSYWVTGIAFKSASVTGANFSTTGYVSTTLSKNGTWGAIVDPNNWHYLRVKVVVTTDGRYNCVLHSRS